MPSYLGQTVDQSFLDMITTIYKGGYVAMHPAHTPPVESDATLLTQMEAALVRGGPDADLLARQLFFIGPASADYAARVKADGASAYWRLGETSGTTAVDIIGGRNGVISGGVTLGQPGAVADGNTAMAFDGTTGQIAATPLTLAATSTVEAWIKTSGTGQMPAFSNAGTAGTAFVGINTGKPYVYCAGATPLSVLGSTTGLNNNQWRHYVVVLSPTETLIYLDGALVQTLAQTKVAPTATQAQIGVDQYIAGSRWTGLLDEVAIYPAALTPAQITAHYNARLQSSSYQRLIAADDAVAHWPLDETTGTTATDVIGGNNGTISGGVTLGVPGPVPGSTAMSFNGTTGYIGVPDGAYKQFGTGPATVECWIKESVAPTFDYPVDLKNDGDTSVAGLGIQGNATHIYCEVGPGAAGAIVLAAASNMLNGQWHHVVAVIERSATDRVHLYVDGVLKASQNLTANGWNLSSGRPMAIARAGDTAVNFYNGLVDEVAIYKVALTPAQVKAHYDARIPRTVY